MFSLIASVRQTLPSWACVITAFGLVFSGQGCRNYFHQIDDARRLAGDLHLQFAQAADASNRAVMADTDEASAGFAGDANRAVEKVERDVAALLPVLRSVSLAAEIQALDEFGRQFAEYRELDSTILALAVENTNIKAQHLAFGPAREAADNFRDALAASGSSIPLADRCSAESLMGKALLAVREIQVLHAPHIAEANDVAMTAMEREMDRLTATAREAVASLTRFLPPVERPRVSTALAALDRFEEMSRQIVALSRRNSNVRSLELSLRTKPALTAACDASLRTLQELLAKEDIAATR